MKKNHVMGLVLGATVATVVIAEAPAYAKDDKPFSVVITAGGQYDSRVSIEQTDVLINQGDVAAVFGASAKYKLAVNDKSSLTIGYDFDQSLHADLPNFDMQTHTLSAGAATKFSGVSIGADYSFMHVLLGGNGFLDMHLISPSISGFINKSVYLRASYTYLNKNFKVANNRNARTQQIAGDAYYFFMNNKAFVNFGGRYDRENAVDLALDYKGFQLSTNIQLPVKLMGRTAKVKFEYAYRQRNYDNIMPALGERRHENRSGFKIAADVPLTEHLSFKPEYRYIDRNSNFALSNYTENVATSVLSYHF